MTKLSLMLTAVLQFGIILASADGQADGIVLEKGERAIRVKVDGQLFTEYDFGNYKKPIFYPLMINEKVGLTRNYPMKKVEGEQPDHPHHKSVWFSHQFNGVMFWAEEGEVKLREIKSFHGRGEKAGFTAVHEWIHDEKIMLTDETQVAFIVRDQWRAIDFTIRLIASHGDVLINDTKEGTFAARVHPNLRNKPHKPSGIKGGATMLNSEGASGAGIWGKAAAWVDYSGEIGGEVYGLAIFDHPDNLRHPANWHARDYGLLAANPFGLHYFEKKPKGAGAYTIKQGESLTLKYRLLIHHGDAETAKIAEKYRQYAGSARHEKSK